MEFGINSFSFQIPPKLNNKIDSEKDPFQKNARYPEMDSLQ